MYIHLNHPWNKTPTRYNLLNSQQRNNININQYFITIHVSSNIACSWVFSSTSTTQSFILHFLQHLLARQHYFMHNHLVLSSIPVRQTVLHNKAFMSVLLQSHNAFTSFLQSSRLLWGRIFCKGLHLLWFGLEPPQAWVFWNWRLSHLPGLVLCWHHSSASTEDGWKSLG